MSMAPDGWWWVSVETLTVAFETRDGVVVDGPPIIGWAIGGAPRPLMRWLRRMAGYRGGRLTTGRSIAKLGITD
jgi:hypothetical protein